MAMCKVSCCKAVAAAVPPVAKTPTVAHKNDKAMAVIGGPMSFPMAVVRLIHMARAAFPERTIQLPQVSWGPMRGKENDFGERSDRDDEREAERAECDADCVRVDRSLFWSIKDSLDGG